MCEMSTILASLELAKSAQNLSAPNPRVGCQLFDGLGELIGQGHAQRAGGPHAGIKALRGAAAPAGPLSPKQPHFAGRA